MSAVNVLIMMGVPSAVTAFCFWWIEKKLERRAKKEEEHEKIREQSQLILFESVNGVMSLAEATARAVQQIPDTHCNGEMQKALEYASDVKKKQKDFLREQAIHSIYHENERGA